MDSIGLQSLALAASLGALIGMIRQWGDQQEGGGDPVAERFAGIRTFILWSLLGYAAALLAGGERSLILVAGIAAVALQLVVKSVYGEDGERLGYTTFAAALLTVMIGGLAYLEHFISAVMLSALTILVLGMKRPLHTMTHHFTGEDIRATLQFVAVTGVILPLVPNQGFGPFGAINPYSLWLMVVLISGLGFIGYILIRLMGASAGIALTGVVGGLASSTATTLAFSRSSREIPQLSDGFTMAIVMACTVMLGRVLVIIGLIHPPLVKELWLPFLVLALPGAVYAGIYFWSRGHGGQSSEIPDFANPLGFGIALKFALIYGAVSLLVRAVAETDLAGSGLLIVSFVSGLTDLDAISLSLAQNVGQEVLNLRFASQAIVVAAVANTLLKAGLAASLGSTALRWRICLVLGITALCGAPAFWIIGI